MKPTKCPAKEKKNNARKAKDEERKESTKKKSRPLSLLSAHARAWQADILHVNQKAAKCCMGGDYYTHTGGGTNHLCIPKVPKYDQYKDCYQDHGGFVFGTEYKLSFKKNLHNHDAPCAVCYVESRGSMPMMPARNDRPSGWSKEYHGYLVTEHYNHKNQKKTTSVSTETLSLFPAAARTQMEHCCTL
ncbi:unnamed protein product [Porites evermanni]|uniref:Uncharacterized protein n=1 Tax=Porites evermanni TaxID=104178 RepID=A0ABN8LHE5_9CNID|nr:unnamed protein product [Porites evermanni]